MPEPLSPQTWKRLALVLASFVVLLIAAEAIVRLVGFDWRLVDKNLYHENADLNNYVADPDPDLMFRVKPNSQAKYCGLYGCFEVNINSLGARNPERARAKPAGVFRIVCLGGSDVYGFAVNDDETWPAQLEQRLHELGANRCEVWNYGAVSYIGIQMAVLGREVVAEIEPDLVLLAPSNLAPIAFLQNAPIASYFARRPDFWARLLSGESAGPLRAGELWLLGHFAVYRLARLAAAEHWRTDNRPFWVWSENRFRQESSRYLRDFLADMRRRVPVCVIVGPFLQQLFGDPRKPIEGVNTFAGATAPTLVLDAAGLGEEYRQIHPPPKVLAWYGDQIARWLLENKFIH